MGQVEGKTAIVTGRRFRIWRSLCGDAGARGCEGGGNGPARCERLEAYDTPRVHAPSPQHIIPGHDPLVIRSPRGRGRRLKGSGPLRRDAA